MLNSTGQISLGGSTAGESVNLELGLTATSAISLNDASVRKLTGTSSGTQISLPTNFWGKANTLILSVSSNIADLNLRTYLIANGWDQNSEVIFTIGSGVYVYSTNTANAALTIDGSWPNGLTITNNGYIMGKGGDGGNYQAGQAGGNGISNGSMNVVFINNGFVLGGGGGGAGVGSNATLGGAGGGGAGGGNGGTGNAGAGYVGGTGGAIGQVGGSGLVYGTSYYNTWVSGGGGGRIIPGTGGVGGLSSATGRTPAGGGGAGGGGGACSKYLDPFPPQPASSYIAGGGGGGGWGASGGAGAANTAPTGGRPALGGDGGAGNAAGARGAIIITVTSTTGGAGGKGIALNGYSMNVTNNGTIYGAVS